MESNQPHLPYPVAIEVYRGGGFRFAGLSHRGAILCLPDGIRASPVRSAADIDAQALALVLETSPPVEILVVGAGADPWLVPSELRARARDIGMSIEGMTTAAAVHTYNILLEENRRVAALLIPLG